MTRWDLMADTAIQGFSAHATNAGNNQFRAEQHRQRESLRRQGLEIQKMKITTGPKKNQKWMCLVNQNGEIVKLMKRVII